jgi:hypothetical protein
VGLAMALRKVKGNFERMFDKNLTDLVRGIRNNKDNEVSIESVLTGFVPFIHSFIHTYILVQYRV